MERFRDASFESEQLTRMGKPADRYSQEGSRERRFGVWRLAFGVRRLAFGETLRNRSPLLEFLTSRLAGFSRASPRLGIRALKFLDQLQHALRHFTNLAGRQERETKQLHE